MYYANPTDAIRTRGQRYRPAIVPVCAKRFRAWVRGLHVHQWVVYPKATFGNLQQVLRYLGRYTHRVAISNHRLVSFDGRQVQFRWRDRKAGNLQRTMELSADEFTRRFLLGDWTIWSTGLETEGRSSW